jgi:hypothetical protein
VVREIKSRLICTAVHLLRNFFVIFGFHVVSPVPDCRHKQEDQAVCERDRTIIEAFDV